MIEVAIPNISEDEAYNYLTSALKNSPKVGDKVVLTDLIKKYMERHRPRSSSGGMVQYRYNPYQANAAPFYSAVWRLCVRGILAQASTFIQRDYGGATGDNFVITEFGALWLSNLSQYDCVPSEYGRFSQLLSNHATRLGDGYRARSQEAINCYRAQTYLACCAMCGAGAESIVLALAIAKKGNEEEILRDYGRAGGRGNIERYLMAGQNSRIQNELPNFTGLLNYWRDEAAHGAETGLGEEEAFTAILLLLRFAKFADERWTEITGR